jgi:hypothetical protein
VRREGTDGHLEEAPAGAAGGPRPAAAGGERLLEPTIDDRGEKLYNCHRAVRVGLGRFQTSSQGVQTVCFSTLYFSTLRRRIAATSFTLGFGLAFGYAVTKAWVESAAG